MLERQITRIKDKLSKLKKQDESFQVFGSNFHKYKLNNVLKIEQIEQFEKTYKILLPKEYRMFLLTLGNGGVGPYYGIVELQDSIYEDLDYKNESYKVNPTLPFPYNTSLESEL